MKACSQPSFYQQFMLMVVKWCGWLFSWHTLGSFATTEYNLSTTAKLSTVANHVHFFMGTVYQSSYGSFKQDSAHVSMDHRLRKVSNTLLKLYQEELMRLWTQKGGPTQYLLGMTNASSYSKILCPVTWRLPVTWLNRSDFSRGVLSLWSRPKIVKEFQIHSYT